MVIWGSGICRALPSCIGSLVFVCARAAEETPPAEQPADEILDLEVVIVTGTRLPVLERDSAVAVTVLERVDVERNDLDSVAKILRSLPMNTGPQINTNTEAGHGAARVNLRGLGPERTLVLVNGRRFPYGGLGADTSVDLNMLPVGMIERIEVLPNSASTIHGSGAVGGVVNIVMRHVESSVGGSWRLTGQDDGRILTAQAGNKFSVSRVDWTVDVDYVKQDGVTAADRDYSAQPLRIADAEGTRMYSGSNTVFDGVFDIPAGNALGLEPGRYLRIPGATGQTAADYRLYSQADSYNNAKFVYSQMPNERVNFLLTGALDVGEATHFSFEGNIHQRDSALKASQDFYNMDANGMPFLDDGTPGIPADNYYNPFGVDLRWAARRFEELGVRRGIHDVDMWRVVLAGSGKLRSWDWEASISESESENVNRSANAITHNTFEFALGPSGPDASGRIVCGERDLATGIVLPERIIANCVPLNIFDGAGTATREQLDYINPKTLVDRGTNDLRSASAALRGPWGRLFQRDVRWAFGADYRHEAGSWITDQVRLQDVNAPITPESFRSSESFHELFAEANVPLLHGRAGIRDSGLTIGWRKPAGGNSEWSTGLNWQPADEVILRASFSPGFRSPSIFELYEENSFELGSALDPCGDDPTPAEQANCAADGVPGGSYEQDESEFLVVLGGNPELRAESGESWGAGATYTPAWSPGVSIDVNYYRIELADRIGVPDAQILLDECAETGHREACDAIDRAPDGHPVRVETIVRNQGRYKTSGFDIALGWSGPTGLGEFDAGLNATRLQQLEDQPLPGGSILQLAGSVTLPEWRAGGHVDWRFGAWRASYSADYIGSMTEEVFPFPPFGIDFEPYFRKVSSRLFQNLEGGYEFDRLSVTVGVENLTDKDPPFINIGASENTDAGMYPLLGRTFFAKISYDLSQD